jgi:hypothetical protein
MKLFIIVKLESLIGDQTDQKQNNYTTPQEKLPGGYRFPELPKSKEANKE